MGFWHTGYIEFHENTGFEESWHPKPPRLKCSLCSLDFGSEEDLRQHRFGAHPFQRPTLFLDGKEIGGKRITITKPLEMGQLVVSGADKVLLNKRAIAPEHLEESISHASNDVCLITLTKNGIDFHFEINIKLASIEDLRGVEAQFSRMVKIRRLDTRVVEEFIEACKQFKSAVGYCDGICNYLYGLMAKERAADCSLAHEQYIDKYNAAAERLATYDRPLAHMICALIAFHFNQFQEAARLWPNSRIGYASTRFSDWLSASERSRSTFDNAADVLPSSIEQVLTELDSERILSWIMRPLTSLEGIIFDIQEMLGRREIEEFDRIKIEILLGETLIALGHGSKALTHARSLRNLPGFENWAESLIREIGEVT